MYKNINIIFFLAKGRVKGVCKWWPETTNEGEYYLQVRGRNRFGSKHNQVE